VSLGVIKPPIVNFKLRRGKNIPGFQGGNALRDPSDPKKRLE
jgi:hypothetical protein